MSSASVSWRSEWPRLDRLGASVQLVVTVECVVVVHKGVRQGDALACLLFNILLENAIRKSGIKQEAQYSTSLSKLWPMLMTC